MSDSGGASLEALIQTVKNELARLQNVAIAFLVLMVISFVLRMFTRLRLVRLFRAEDWTMVLAFVCPICS